MILFHFFKRFRYLCSFAILPIISILLIMCSKTLRYILSHYSCLSTVFPLPVRVITAASVLIILSIALLHHARWVKIPNHLVFLSMGMLFWALSSIISWGFIYIEYIGLSNYKYWDVHQEAAIWIRKGFYVIWGVILVVQLVRCINRYIFVRAKAI